MCSIQRSFTGQCEFRRVRRWVSFRYDGKLLWGAAIEVNRLSDAVLVLRHVAIRTNFAGCLHWVRRDKARMAAHTAISFFLGHRIVAHGSTTEGFTPPHISLSSVFLAVTSGVGLT